MSPPWGGRKLITGCIVSDQMGLREDGNDMERNCSTYHIPVSVGPFPRTGPHQALISMIPLAFPPDRHQVITEG